MDESKQAKARSGIAGKLLLLLAPWTLLALVFTPQQYLLSAEGRNPRSWAGALLSNFVLFYAWALLTPLIVWVCNRLPLEKGRVVRNTLLLALLSLPFAAAHLLLLKYVNLLIHPGRRASLEGLLIGVAATDIMVYFGVVAAAQALIYFRKYQEREQRLAQAQLQVLKTQLQPHFLFNTLNAISELIYEAPEVAEQTLARLSDLLRLSLGGNQAQQTTLGSELELLEKYLAIQRTLLQERLRVRFEVADEVLDACVPSLILQPLVENAIRHGIAPRARGGVLEIHAAREANHLLLEVRDDGLGLQADGATPVGIGLSNTQARLQHLYGDRHRFVVESPPSGGVCVRLRLPYRELALSEREED